MQERTIKVEYSHPRGYDVGYRAENNFTVLALPIPAELEGADSYRVYFESTVGEHLQTELLTPADGYVAVKITSDVVPEPGNMAAQLVAFGAGEIVGYAPMITGSAKVSIPDGTERLSHSLAAEIALNTAARHGHDNKSVIDLLTADDTGTLLYDGKVIGGGASDFIIKMTVTSDDNGKYTVTSCSTTVEQIDAAVADEKRVVVIATDTDNNLSWDIPIVQGFNGSNYYFATFLLGQAILSFVQKVGENQARWQFIVGQIGADFISYSNDALPNMSTVGEALDELVKKSGHTHTNKDVLDKLSDSNGKLQYNGSDISVTKNGVISALGYTPQAVSTKVSTGSNIALADNTEYRLTDVTTLTLTYPTGNFECWMRLNFAASGNVTVTLPTGTKYIGTAPDFKNGETWELSFKDKILAAQKVGEGT